MYTHRYWGWVKTRPNIPLRILNANPGCQAFLSTSTISCPIHRMSLKLIGHHCCENAVLLGLLTAMAVRNHTRPAMRKPLLEGTAMTTVGSFPVHSRVLELGASDLVN